LSLKLRNQEREAKAETARSAARAQLLKQFLADIPPATPGKPAA